MRSRILKYGKHLAIAAASLLFTYGVLMGAVINPLRVTGLKFTASDNTIYASSYGVVCNSSTDDTTPMTAALAAMTAGSVLKLPAGTCMISDTLTMAQQYGHVEGMGVDSTIIDFNPASAKSLWKFSAGASILNGASIKGMYIKSHGGNTQKKTAIEVDDNSGFVAEDIWIDPINASTWTGSTSVGIQLKGREFTRLSRIRAFTDVPIQISADPNTAAIGLDHSRLNDLYLRPTPSSGNAAILIDDTIVIDNLTLDGYQSWIVDKYGLKWIETGGSPTVAINVAISGVRCEQAVDATGYCIYIDHTKGIQNVDVRDSYMATAQNGMHFNGINNLTIRNSVFPASDITKTHLDLGATIGDLYLSNNFVNSTTLTNLGTMSLVWASAKRLAGQTMPSTAVYTDATTYGTRGGLQYSATLYMSGASAWKNTDATSSNPYKFDTSNAWTGSAEFMSGYNNGTRKWYIDGNGAFASKNGSYDTDGSVAAFFGGFNANSVTVGRTTTTTTLAGAQALHRTTVADVNYTTVAGDYLVAYTSMTAGRTATIQCSTANRVFVIKNESSGAFAITITPASGTCDGAASCATTAAARAPAVRIYADGTNCYTM